MSTDSGIRSEPHRNAAVSTRALMVPATSKRTASSMLAWRQARP